MRVFAVMLFLWGQAAMAQKCGTVLVLETPAAELLAAAIQGGDVVVGEYVGPGVGAETIRLTVVERGTPEIHAALVSGAHSASPIASRTVEQQRRRRFRDQELNDGSLVAVPAGVLVGFVSVEASVLTFLAGLAVRVYSWSDARESERTLFASEADVLVTAIESQARLGQGRRYIYWPSGPDSRTNPAGLRQALIRAGYLPCREEDR